MTLVALLQRGAIDFHWPWSGIGSCERRRRRRRPRRRCDDEAAALPGGDGHPARRRGPARRAEIRAATRTVRSGPVARSSAARSRGRRRGRWWHQAVDHHDHGDRGAGGEHRAAGDRRRRGSAPRRPVPSSAPTRPPATPVDDSATADASGSSADGQGSGIATCDQPPLGRRGRRCRSSAPALAPKASGAAFGVRGERDERERLDEQRLGEVERHAAASSGRRPTPTISETTPRITRKKIAAPIAPPRPTQRRAATSASAAARAISPGWKMKRNCGTPKSNSPWKVDRPIEQAAA